MTIKFSPLLFLLVLLARCTTEQTQSPNTIQINRNETVSIDTFQLKTSQSQDGLELFIDSMASVDFVIDTNRIKQTIWSFVGKFPKVEYRGHSIIQLPFPVDTFQSHFSDPRTYFFAHWNKEHQTFKGENDYLLMTWHIDSTGIRNEEMIYTSLHEYMGNFPCYIFRQNSTVYAMSHRMTVAWKETKELTSKLKNYMGESSSIYCPNDLKDRD